MRDPGDTEGHKEVSCKTESKLESADVGSTFETLQGQTNGWIFYNRSQPSLQYKGLIR
jgi:hypothetical protein